MCIGTFLASALYMISGWLYKNNNEGVSVFFTKEVSLRFLRCAETNLHNGSITDKNVEED